MELRPEDITEIVKIFNDSELVELRLEIGGHRLYLSKQVGSSPGWESSGPMPTLAAGPAAPEAAGARADASSPGPIATPGAGAEGAALGSTGGGSASGPTPTPGSGATDASAPTAASAPALSGTEPAAPGSAAGTTDDRLVDLCSPLLGVFYRRPAPDQPPFVEVGSVVGPEDPVCIIDVMKMFSRIPAGIAGRVAEILVEDGQLVEHGQVLMRLEPH